MAAPRIPFDFCDMGATYYKTDNPIYRLLRTRFPVEIADRPDFLLYSHAGHHHRLHGCVRIFYTTEADRPPDWDVCDYALTPVYSDDPRHLRYPPYALLFDPAMLVQGSGEAEAVAPRKTKFCAFLSSYRNEKTRLRWDFFERLSRRKRVDSAGRAGNNAGVTVPFGIAPTVDFLRPYKFFIAFENKAVPGYVSEKLLLGLAARCIPIYFGCPRVAEDYNPRRFLNYHDFPSEDALIERILEIDRDEALFRQYLAEPSFHGNQPNVLFNPDYYLDFFGKIFNTPIVPAATRAAQGLRPFGRWTLAKRDQARTPGGGC